MFPTAKQVGDAVKYARFSAGLERIQVAKNSGVGIEMIAKVEQGKKMPRASTLKRLAYGMDTTPEYLMNLASTMDS